MEKTMIKLMRHLGIIVFMVLVQIHPLWAASRSVGTLTPLGHSAEVYLGNQKISVATAVTKEDIIRTGGGTAELVMNNGDRFNLSSNTIISVETYVDDKSQDEPSFIKLFIGKVQAMVEREDKESVRIKTENAMVGVKGTEFIVEVPSAEVTQVTTITGIVSLRKLDAADNELLITAGFRSILLHNLQPFAPIAISKKDRMQMNQIFPSKKAPALKPVESKPLDDVLIREVERHIVQEALREQALLGVDLNF
ncbi:MAG: FecR domain-containing protein [SAR324 cluster bacterium]|nr:FecR domain-containing protein [SAR324 cluster bacterium]